MTRVCLWCKKEPPPGSYPLGSSCPNCGKPLLLTEPDPDPAA